MMEYTSKYWNMLTPLIKKSLLKRYGKEETAELLPQDQPDLPRHASPRR